MSLSPVRLKDPPRRAAIHVKSVESSSVFPLVWCDSWKRELPAQVSLTVTLIHGSKITWFVAKSPRVAEQCDVNIHLILPNFYFHFTPFVSLNKEACGSPVVKRIGSWQACHGVRA
ncbi:hypothetical protein TNCV_3686151 [Trichonephila clavipes]|nr:hypothetical protein TNCV_3686151 [Trichonephila clavipes]